MAGGATQAVLLAGAVLLGMDLLSTVVTGPPPVAAPVAASSALASASAPSKSSRGLPPGLHVRLCTACSYKGYYNQLATQLQQRYPESVFRASASTYPPSWPRRAAAGAATLAQGAALAVTLAGDRVLPALGAADPLPRWYEETVKPRRTAFALGAWFFPNLLKQAAEATGAFEVLWDGELIFSKLQLGRFPLADELGVAIDRRIVVGAGAGAGGRGDRDASREAAGDGERQEVEEDDARGGGGSEL